VTVSERSYIYINVIIIYAPQWLDNRRRETAAAAAAAAETTATTTQYIYDDGDSVELIIILLLLYLPLWETEKMNPVPRSFPLASYSHTLYRHNIQGVPPRGVCPRRA